MKRYLVILVVSVIFLILVLQNLQTVEFNFLFWSFESSLSLVLIITFTLAVILGLAIILPLKLIQKLKNNKKGLTKENEAKNNTTG